MTNPTERDLTDKLADALEKMLRYADINLCRHEETHRGGVIWTICDQCGRKWADDEGGFKPQEDPEEFTLAHKALAAYRAQRDGERYRELTEEDVIQEGDEYHFMHSEWRPFTSMAGERYAVGYWPARRPLAKGEA